MSFFWLSLPSLSLLLADDVVAVVADTGLVTAVTAGNSRGSDALKKEGRGGDAGAAAGFFPSRFVLGFFSGDAVLLSSSCVVNPAPRVERGRLRKILESILLLLAS